MNGQKLFHIQNRGNHKTPFDPQRLLHFLQSLLYDLHTDFIDLDEIVLKVTSGLNDNMTSAQLIDLTAETIAFKTILHPDYSLLAARVYMTLLHKNTPSDLLDYANLIYKFVDVANRNCQLLSDEVYEIFVQHHVLLQEWIDYRLDYSYEFFGLKTLEKSYLLKVHNKIAERPQQLIMRVAIGIHGKELEKVRETYELMSQKWFTHATPTSTSLQSPGPGAVMPRALAKGFLKTLNP